MTKTILITGASTGFGRDTAETLARAGHRVFASMRDPQAKNQVHANALREQNIDVVELDVTNAQSVDRAVAAVIDTVRRHERGTGYLAAVSMLSREWCYSSRAAEERFGYRRTPIEKAVDLTLQAGTA